MRSAGILLHPTSLPGPGPCGDLGDGALRFLDWLAAAGCGLWQVLPLCPPGGGFSPYSSQGARAGGTHLISIDRLVTDGLLRWDEVHPRPRTLGRVDVDALERWHEPLVLRAGLRYAGQDPAAIRAFCAANAWAEDWALFRALSRGSDAGWERFSPELQRREPAALARAREQHAEAILAELGAQALFRRQWDALHQAARERKVRIVGDLPIYMSGDGCDVWAHRELFLWGEDGRADPLSGVPPDYFSPQGQFWGNPMYDWAAHKKSGFAWWIARFRESLELCDVVRSDHFRGFSECWAVPRSAQGDARLGSWTPAPGKALFTALRKKLGDLPIIAEDLGHITPDVEALRDGFGLPGMKILQFAFVGDPDHAFLPHNWEHPRWVVYTGTHDNDTVRGWYDSASEEIRHRFRVYNWSSGHEPNWDLIRLAWSSTAAMAVAPMQDVLGLGADGRMNTPGLAKGNWLWRCPLLPEQGAHRLRELAQSYGRTPGPRG